MKQGGAPSNELLFGYVLNRIGFNILNIPLNTTNDEFPIKGNACSAFTVLNENGDGYFFGRNYN